MTEPTPEAMEAAARALPDAMACAPWPPSSEDELLATIEAGHLPEDYDLADANHRAHLAIVREVVTAVWPIAEATVRAKVAAEIRAGIATSVARTEISMIGPDGVAGGQWLSESGIQRLLARIAEGNGDETKTSSAGPSGG